MPKMTKMRAKDEVWTLTTHIHMLGWQNIDTLNPEINRARNDLTQALDSLLQCDINIENIFNIGTVILEAYNLGRLTK